MVQILAEAERTSRLIGSLLVLARADAGEGGFHRKLTELSTSVREAVEQERRIAAEKRVQLTDELGQKPLTILGDAEALTRLFFILIENAVKYNTEGGLVQVQLSEQSGHAVFRIMDSGIGIAEKDLGHIFDRFWRADKVRSRGMGGAGLGLSIARWIVDRHQGTIEVASQLGKGASFIVKIPLAAPLKNYE